MTDWMPWSPTVEPIREDYEALIDRLVRIKWGPAWRTVRVSGIEQGRDELVWALSTSSLSGILWPIPKDSYATVSEVERLSTDLSPSGSPRFSLP